MSDPSLAVQKALWKRFTETPILTALVPAENIRDRKAYPILDPSISIGEDQVIDLKDNMMRDRVRVISTIHIWKKETSLDGVKEISGAIRRAIGRVRRLDLADPDFVCVDCNIESVQFLRDPDGDTSHGVVVIRSLIQQCWSVEI